MTAALGPEHFEYVRGKGYGTTRMSYFNVPRRSTKESMMKIMLDEERKPNLDVQCPKLLNTLPTARDTPDFYMHISFEPRVHLHFVTTLISMATNRWLLSPKLRKVVEKSGNTPGWVHALLQKRKEQVARGRPAGSPFFIGQKQVYLYVVTSNRANQI